jgi:plasmid stabilization system protein ParE
MKTRLSPAALHDIEEILQFLSMRSAYAASGFRKRFSELRRLVGQYPHGGRQTEHDGLRYLNTDPYPYLIFYELTDGEVMILRIMHGARDPRAMPGRPR